MPNRKSVIAVLVVAASVAAGCGTRLSHQQLLRDQSGSLGSVTNSTGPDGAFSAGSGAPAGVAAASGPTTGTFAAASRPVVGGGAEFGIVGAGSGSSSQGCRGAKSTIVIGSVGEQSGIIGSVVAEGPKAVAAWVTMVNARGGLACHLLKYLVLDDGGDPSRHQAMVQQLVEQRHVVGFVQMDASITGKASVAYLTEHRIPVIGSDGGGEWFYDSPMYFPQSPSGDQLVKVNFFAVGTVAKEHELSRLAILSCIEASFCSTVHDEGPAVAAAAGMQTVYNGTGSITQLDYTSNCLDAQKAQAQILLMALDANSIARVARSCSSVGYKPVYATGSAAASIDMVRNPLLDGLIVAMPTIPWFVTTNAAVADYQAVFRRYAPGVRPSPGSVSGWTTAEMFEAATKGLADPTTSEAILGGLYTLRGNDLGGLTQPLTFTAGEYAPKVVCYWVAQINGGQWVSPNNGARRCL